MSSRFLVRAAFGGGHPVGTPLPSFTVLPSISPTSGAVGTTFTGTDGTVTNGSIVSRRWILSGTQISTGFTATPVTAGSLTFEDTANGPGGTTVQASNPIIVTAAGGSSGTFDFSAVSNSGLITLVSEDF